MRTSGNTIFLTGGTSGIGLGLALRWQEAGNTVIVAGRRTELLERITAEHPGIGAVRLDVADPASIAAAFHEVTSRWPEVDVLVNMAGIMAREDLRTGADLATAEATVATNLLGPIRLQAAFVPYLLTRPSAVVMNVSSGLAFVPRPATPTYSATKAALHSLTVSLRQQLAGTTVQVIELAPPLVQTELMESVDDPRAMPLTEFLDEVVQLLADHPDADEVLVQRVHRQRFAEATGAYPEVLAMLTTVT